MMGTFWNVLKGAKRLATGGDRRQRRQTNSIHSMGLPHLRAVEVQLLVLATGASEHNAQH